VVRYLHSLATAREVLYLLKVAMTSIIEFGHQIEPFYQSQDAS
jgi:hypothetical protein